jgi:hypothetical protein
MSYLTTHDVVFLSLTAAPASYVIYHALLTLSHCFLLALIACDVVTSRTLVFVFFLLCVARTPVM